MATPKQTPAGTWRIQIEIRGERDANTLPTKREAIEWAARRKTEMMAKVNGRLGEMRTLAESMERYKTTPAFEAKKGVAKEALRLKAFLKHPCFPHRVLMSDLTPEHIAAWRDARLKVVSAGAVVRDMSVLSGVFEIARKEWRWIATNPMLDVTRPGEPDHRDVIISNKEIRKMLRVFRWTTRKPVRSVSVATGFCFVLALQTGMRASELCGLRWSDVFPDYVRVHDGKTKQARRQVPLTPAAARTIKLMEGYDPEYVIGLHPSSLDANFRKYRKLAKLSGFKFHDARHTAATRIAQRLHILDLCKMFGWSDPKRAMVYYNPTGRDIARRLNAVDARAPVAAAPIP